MYQDERPDRDVYPQICAAGPGKRLLLRLCWSILSIMIKKWFLLALCLMIAPAVSGAMYKWKDENGRIHYSERPPEEGAEEFQLPKAVTYTPKAVADSSGNDPDKADAKGYQELKITKPEMNETVRSNKGEVQVQFTLTPTLLHGHQYKLFLDGKALDQAVPKTAVMLSGLTRGSHTVVVKVADANGVFLITSPSVIFHLRRESELSPDSSSSSEDNTKAYDSSYGSDASNYKDDATSASDASDFKDKASYDSDAASYKDDATYKSDSADYESGAKSYSSGTKANTNTYKPSYTPSYKQSN